MALISNRKMLLRLLTAFQQPTRAMGRASRWKQHKQSARDQVHKHTDTFPSQMSQKDRGERGVPRGKLTATSFQATSHLEELEDWLNPDAQDLEQDFQRAEEQLRRKVLFKTIQRKYFRPAPEPNLLTWAAKEQMRFLAAEYPDEWTPARLAESFPVSHQGAIRVLQSSYRARTAEEVIRHDRRIWKNWRGVKTPTLANAAGVLSLPQPSRKWHGGGVRGGRPARKFESIVSGYCEAKLNALSSGDNSSLKEHEAASRKLLASIIAESIPSEDSRKKLTTGKATAETSVTPSRPQHSDKTSENGVKTLLDASVQNQHVAGKPNSSASENMWNSVTISNMAAENDNDRSTTGFWVTESDEYKMDVLNRVRRGEYRDTGRVTSYVYDEVKGYQHLGGTEPPAQRLRVGKRRNKDVVYRKGNDVYDNDGEFLYRIP